MEAMMRRQRQLYGECTDPNWIKIQRNDNSSLSKSKAERYRWCVQENTNDGCPKNPHVPMTGDGVMASARPNVSKMKKPGSSTRPNVLQDELYGTVFTGASKFRCRDCGSTFNTLVDLTVHMSNTGHFRDENIASVSGQGSTTPESGSQPPTHISTGSDEAESAEKVLKCLGCGHSFDSLQDLSVHMIRTKHYENVPSLRFYSQKSDMGATDGSAQSLIDRPASSQHNNNNSAADASDGEITDPQQSLLERPDLEKMLGYGINPALFGGVTSLPHLNAMAALGLLGIPPYFMPMPFLGPLNGYGFPNPAFNGTAGMAAPWMPPMPSLNIANLLSAFLHQRATIPTSMPPTAVSGSPVSSDGDSPPTESHPSPSTNRFVGAARSETEDDSGPDFSKSKLEILRCHHCREHFSSMQKLTNHIQETAHFPFTYRSHASEKLDRTPGQSSPNSDIDGGRTACSSPTSPKRQRSGESPVQMPSVSCPGPSPLEHLTNLVNGGALRRGETTRTYATPYFRDDSVRQRVSMTPPTVVSQNSPSPRTRPHTPRYEYSNPSPRRVRDSPSDSPTPPGFDFIKSIESTIQSAIDKVTEAPSSGKRAIPNLRHEDVHVTSRRTASFKRRNHAPHRPIFKPYSTNMKRYSPARSPPICDEVSARSPGVADDVTILEVSSPCSKRNDLTQTTAGTSPREPSPHPLDLSNLQQVADVHGSPERRKSTQSSIADDLSVDHVTDQETKLASKVPSKEERSHLYSGESREKNCDSFELEHSRQIPHAMKIGTQVQEPTQRRKRKFRGGSSSESLHSDNLETNHLQEIQRIVDSTEFRRRPESLTDIATKDDKHLPWSGHVGVVQRKRSLNGESVYPDPPKRSRQGSILSDLVTHEDDAPSIVNPLTQIENLVNQKIGESPVKKVVCLTSSPSQNISPRQIRTNAESRPCDSNAYPCANPMSALMNFFDSVNGIFSTNYPTSALPAKVPPNAAEIQSQSLARKPVKNRFIPHGDRPHSAPVCDRKATCSQDNGRLSSDEVDSLHRKVGESLRRMVSEDHDRKRPPPDAAESSISEADDDERLPWVSTPGNEKRRRGEKTMTDQTSMPRPSSSLQLQFQCFAKVDNAEGNSKNIDDKMKNKSEKNKLPRGVVKS